MTSHTVQTKLNGTALSIETGKVAKQADGAVVVRCGGTIVLSTVVATKSPMEGRDFLPLTVEYRERAYAGGKIPGGFFKREGRPDEKETLTCRLIDRPVRPLFPKNFRNEIQVINLVISADDENDPDVLAMVGSSAALCLSGLPFAGPLGAVLERNTRNRRQSDDALPPEKAAEPAVSHGTTSEPHVLKLQGKPGKILRIEALVIPAPYGMPSGWSH